MVNFGPISYLVGTHFKAIDVGGTVWSRTKNTYLQCVDNLYFTFTDNLISRVRAGGEEIGSESKIKPTSNDPDAGETLSDLLFRAACKGQC